MSLPGNCKMKLYDDNIHTLLHTNCGYMATAIIDHQSDVHETTVTSKRLKNVPQNLVLNPCTLD